MAIIEGKALRLYEGSSSTVIGKSTNCTLSISSSMISIRHKDQTTNHIEKDPDEVSGTLTTEAFIEAADGDHAGLAAKIIAGTEITWAFHDGTTGTGNHKWSGTGYLTEFSENAPVDGKATYSITIETNGTISLGTVPAS